MRNRGNRARRGPRGGNRAFRGPEYSASHGQNVSGGSIHSQLAIPSEQPQLLAEYRPHYHPYPTAAQRTHTSSMAQSGYDNNALQAPQVFPGWHTQGTYSMNELGSYSETQGSSGHQDLTGFGSYHGRTVEGFEYLQGSSGHQGLPRFDPCYGRTAGSSGNQDPIGEPLQEFEHFTGLQSLDVEQSIAQPGSTCPLLLPFPASESIAPPFNPPPVPPPPGGTSTNSYVDDRVLTARAPVRPGEAMRGHPFEVIHVKPNTQKSVRKASRARLPVVVPPPGAPTPAAPAVHAAPAAPAPTQATLDIASSMKRLRKEAQDKILLYILEGNPMRSSDKDDIFFNGVVKQLATTHLGDGKAEWLSNVSEQKSFRASAKRQLNDVIQTFKDVARLVVKDAYSLRVPLGSHHSISAIWETRVAELLVNWNYVDAPTMVSETNDDVIGVFNHPALTTLLVEAMWPPVGKLHKLIHSPGVDFDKLIAFSAAILHWALDNLKKGPETLFEVVEYEPVYNQALERILEIREAGDDTRLSCLNNVIRDVHAMGQAYVHHYT